jgi:TRAP-type mannitol/chloroaromatic compound transport system permease large subunit
LFYLKSVAPPSITMAVIFRAALSFLFLKALGLALVILFPELILWLPRMVYG